MAVEAATRWIEREPGNNLFRRHRAESLSALENCTDAIADYDILIKAEPSEQRNLLSVATAMRDWVCRKKRRPTSRLASHQRGRCPRLASAEVAGVRNGGNGGADSALGRLHRVGERQTGFIRVSFEAGPRLLRCLDAKPKLAMISPARLS